MKTIKQLLTPLALLALTSTLSFATVYSDGEDGSTNGWRVYDNSPAGATVENVYDEEKQSNVIVLKGDERKNSYMIGDKKNSKSWKNNQEFILRWSMKFSEKFKISVYLKTKKGSRILYYDAKDTDKGIYKKKYIRLGLGSKSQSGKWVDMVRDIEADLQKQEPDNSIKYIKGIKIQGSGRVDNLELLNGQNPPSSGDLKISEIKTISVDNNFAKIGWKLNHGATGQVEYGTTTEYGSFSKEEKKFKYKEHRQGLKGLKAGTTYHYRVISKDEAGDKAVSEDMTFKTKGGDNNTVNKFLQWSDKATLDDGREIQVSFKDNKKSQCKLIITDITDKVNPSVLGTYDNCVNLYGNGIVEGGQFRISPDGKSVYLLKEMYYEGVQAYDYLVIYDISNPSSPKKLSETHTVIDIFPMSYDFRGYNPNNSNMRILNNHTMLLSGWSGDGDANGCDQDSNYIKIIDFSNPSKPIVSRNYIKSMNDNEEQNGCSNYFSIDNDDNSHYLKFYNDDREVPLQGKPYQVLPEYSVEGILGPNTYVAMGDDGVEVINYYTGISRKVVETNISVKEIAKVGTQLLLFNETSYEYIDVP